MKEEWIHVIFFPTVWRIDRNWTSRLILKTCNLWFLVAPEGTYPNGIRGVFKDLMKTEGPKALFRGIVPVMLRAFPANAVSLISKKYSICEVFDFLL